MGTITPTVQTLLDISRRSLDQLICRGSFSKTITPKVQENQKSVHWIDHGIGWHGHFEYQSGGAIRFNDEFRES